MSPAGYSMIPDYYRFQIAGGNGYRIPSVRITTAGFYATETSQDDPWAGD